jgi:hypothetical protein
MGYITFDPTLPGRVGLSNSATFIAMNPYFDTFAKHIFRNLSACLPADPEYTSAANRALYESCQVHAKDNSTKPLHGEKTLYLVHPFYLHLRHMAQLSKRASVQAKQFMDTLFELIHISKDVNSLDVVLVDTIHAYAAYSSLLLENDLVDGVIFTQDDRGIPTKKEYSQGLTFPEDSYSLGMFNGSCFESFIRRMHYVKRDTKVLKDLVLGAYLNRRKNKIAALDAPSITLFSYDHHYVSKDLLVSSQDFIDLISSN